MKTVIFVLSILFSLITLVFAALGLMSIIPFYIAQPIAFVSLATFLMVKSVEAKLNKEKIGFILLLSAALFCYFVATYILFFG